MGFQINSKYSSEEEKLKRRLRFFFLNPVEKWVATRRFPFKLFFQIVKIILVTLQVIDIALFQSFNSTYVCTFQLFLFASFRDSHISYVRTTEVAFSHMFLQGWDVSREVLQYPPAAGPLAIYTKDELTGYVEFAVKNVRTIKVSL